MRPSPRRARNIDYAAGGGVNRRFEKMRSGAQASAGPFAFRADHSCWIIHRGAGRGKDVERSPKNAGAEVISPLFQKTLSPWGEREGEGLLATGERPMPVQTGLGKDVISRGFRTNIGDILSLPAFGPTPTPPGNGWTEADNSGFTLSHQQTNRFQFQNELPRRGPISANWA